MAVKIIQMVLYRPLNMAVKLIQIKITPPPIWFIYIVLSGLISVLHVGSIQVFVGIYFYKFVVPYNLKISDVERYKFLWALLL